MELSHVILFTQPLNQSERGDYRAHIYFCKATVQGSSMYRLAKWLDSTSPCFGVLDINLIYLLLFCLTRKVQVLFLNYKVATSPSRSQGAGVTTKTNRFPTLAYYSTKQNTWPHQTDYIQLFVVVVVVAAEIFNIFISWWPRCAPPADPLAESGGEGGVWGRGDTRLPWSQTLGALKIKAQPPLIWSGNFPSTPMRVRDSTWCARSQIWTLV